MTKQISGIGVMFVLVILYLSISIINEFNYLDFAYLLFMISCFIRFIYIRKSGNHEKYNTLKSKLK